MNERFDLRRSSFLGLAALEALSASPVGAQQGGKTYRVGILSGRTLAFDRPLLVEFRRTLSGLGYQEGTNLEIIYRGVGGDYKQLPEPAAELVRLKADAIVTESSLATAAAKRATTSVPIVMIGPSDPVGSGFIGSLARPGGNITGTTNMADELVGKQLQLLKELVPRLQRVAVTRNPGNPGNRAGWRVAESVARSIGIRADAVNIPSPDQIDAAFKLIPRLQAGAILVLPEPVLASNAARVARLVAAQRLPAVYPNDRFIVAGGLMSYGPSQVTMWRQAATYVDRIFKGARPADLPVERPTTFDLIVNLKTARALGITVPQSILLRATEIIR